MRNLTFKHIAAWNFLPFGPEGTQFPLKNYGNIILIRGENRDAKAIDSQLPNEQSEECKTSSNGTGKSSIQEIIVYGLFGKTVKQKLKVNDVVHNLVRKDCKVELIFGDYRVVRTRMDGGKKESNSLRLWESADGIWDKTTEITQGTMITTQKQIETIIGLSYDAFVNMCIFTDDQRLCFLECDNPHKKEIVENLLSLGEYREWHENAKELRKAIKQNIDSKAKEYNLLLSNKDDANRRLLLTEKKHTDWQLAKKTEIDTLEKSILTKKQQLASTDAGAALLAYQDAQAKINSINDALPPLEVFKADFEKKLQLVKQKEDELKVEAQGLTKQYEEFSTTAKTKLNERKKKEAEITDLGGTKPGTRCGKCRSVVEEENIVEYVGGLKLEINNINLDIQTAVTGGKDIAVKTEDLKLRQNKATAIVKAIETKIGSIDAELRTLRNNLVAASKVREPKADSSEALLEQEISQIKNSVESKTTELAGRSPYQDIIDNDKVELDRVTLNVSDKELEVKTLEAELPYLDYWISGFGEQGIRKWVVEGIIPELNTRINYWLQFLIDNKITLKFDNELNEKIERNPVDGDPYVYHAMSTGQRRRLNLAVSQSFAHVMTISSGSIPSIVFLDEVSTNVDPLGVQGIYNMICELAEDKQVFITTHDPDLLRMLEGADVIKLIHENGYTKLVQE
jgi:DNA repair exonuclease SbcCD ATPase subunit